jgi:hypothetical protein
MPTAIGFIQIPVAAAKGSKGTRIWERRGKGDNRAQERIWMRVKRQEIQSFRAIIQAKSVRNHVFFLFATNFERQLAVGAWREPQRSKQKCSRKSE